MGTQGVLGIRNFTNKNNIKQIDKNNTGVQKFMYSFHKFWFLKNIQMPYNFRSNLKTIFDTAESQIRTGKKKN